MFNFIKRLFGKPQPVLTKLSQEEGQSIEDCLAQNGLPFDSLAAAELYYFPVRDKDLAEIEELIKKYPELSLDFKLKSLKRLEEFYFKVFVDKKIDIGITKERIEELITQYNRQLFVVNGLAEWVVLENDYAEGRYELGILFIHGYATIEPFGQGLEFSDKKKRNHLYDSSIIYIPEERLKELH